MRNFIYLIKGDSFIQTLHESKFIDIPFKSINTFNETSCWDQCEKELACNSISYFYLEFANGDNCLLYTNESPETIKTETFVSKMRKPKSKFNIFFNFIKTVLILLELI